MSNIVYKEESYAIVGILFEVHKNLGGGFSEIVYKDALEYEFSCHNIDYEREKEYAVHYKNIILKHKFFADFVINYKIILEIKSCQNIQESHISQCLNYLKISDSKLGLIANFKNDSLEYKRIVF